MSMIEMIKYPQIRIDIGDFSRKIASKRLYTDAFTPIAQVPQYKEFYETIITALKEDHPSMAFAVLRYKSNNIVEVWLCVKLLDTIKPV